MENFVSERFQFAQAAHLADFDHNTLTVIHLVDIDSTITSR